MSEASRWCPVSIGADRLKIKKKTLQQLVAQISTHDQTGHIKLKYLKTKTTGILDGHDHTIKKEGNGPLILNYVHENKL